MTSSVEKTIRIEGGHVMATLVRLTGDFQLAEDALQDAVVLALERWPTEGVPDKPGAWLTTVARNRALDRLRRDGLRHHKEAEALAMLTDPPEPSRHDDRLRLIFTCCHPALSPEAQVALTLRTICRLTTVEIARAFLVADSTMGQRISRAKRKVSVANIPYRVPEDHELPDRLPSVLAVVYVIFTTGHHAPIGSLDARVDLADEAIRLGQLLAELMPDEPEVLGLLALMLATNARRGARLDSAGDLVLLGDQDRSRWDGHAIEEASTIVEQVLPRRPIGPYRIEAAIACLHGQAGSDEETDWPQIAELYRLLERTSPGNAVRVNRAVAEAKVLGPAAGLTLLETVEGLENWHLLWSVRADLLRRLERGDEAAEAYRRALECEMNDSDRRFLLSRLADLSV